MIVKDLILNLEEDFARKGNPISRCNTLIAKTQVLQEFESYDDVLQKVERNEKS